MCGMKHIFILNHSKSLFLKLYLYFFKDFIYLFLDRGQGREKERERNINVWLPPTCPPLGTWSTTQACALTGNQTGDPLVCKYTQSTEPHQQGRNCICVSIVG